MTTTTGSSTTGIGPIVVCWKWVALDGDERRAGVSAADQAALETALQLGEALGAPVTVVSLGPRAAETWLREALATGASRAVRIDASIDLPSAKVAAGLAKVVRGADWILCGDYSADRGSGSVPAFLAAELGAAQALGLLNVSAEPSGDGNQVPEVAAIRRLDGGRREKLRVSSPAVLSVEGSVARLRRATLPAEMAARDAVIDTMPGPRSDDQHADLIRPYRPRPRVVPAPAGAAALDRIRALTDATTAVAHGETVTLDPPAAADRIVEALVEWGYLD